jgi:hypothetical protein
MFGVTSVTVLSRLCSIHNVQVSESIPRVGGWNHPPLVLYPSLDMIPFSYV